MGIYRRLYLQDRAEGVRYCTGDNDGATWRKGCGSLTENNGAVCACGAATRPVRLDDCITLPENAPEEPESFDEESMAAVSEIFSNIRPDASGSITFTASESLAVKKFYGMRRSGMEWWSALVRCACSAHNSAISDGIKVREKRLKNGR